MTLGRLIRHETVAAVMRGRVRVVAVLGALIAVASGCEQSVGSDTPQVSRIEVDPAQVTVSAGRTTTLTAQVFGADGGSLGAVPVFWSTQNAQVATVNQSGVVTGVATGATQIAASLNGRSGVASVTVTSLPVAVVRVTPSEGDVTIGKTLQLNAEALDSDGGPLISRTPTWSSTNTSVATVNATGLVSAIGAGSATIRASVDGVLGTSFVRVVPVAVSRIDVNPPTANVPQGDPVQLEAVVTDAQGNTLSGRVVVWSSNNASVAVVDNTGRVQSVSPGVVTITATCEGISDSAVITVTLVPVSSVTISPTNPSVVVGRTLTLSATLGDSKGNVLNGRTVAWSSSTPAVATINAFGTVTGVALGTTTIGASSGGVTGTTQVTVVAVPAAAVTVNPPSGTVDVGATLTLTAVARDAQGNVLTGRTTVWSTNNANVATVSAAGVVTGVSPGGATITAAIDGALGFSTITVTLVPVATVTVTPNPSSVIEGGTVPLTATARDAAGNTLSGRAITWSSSNTTVATVASSGVVSGLAPGSATITATATGAGSGGSSPFGTSALTVMLIPVASVTVSPAADTVQVGGTQPFTATLKSATGQTLSPTGRSLTWSSQQPSKATVNSSTGVATGVAAGQATIVATASSPGQGTPATGSGSLTVLGPVNTVVVTLADTLWLPGTLAGSAVVTDAAGQVLPGKTVNLTSSSTSVATVAPSSATADATGKVTFTVTGVSTGNTNITATSDGKNDAQTVRVVRPVASISFSPPSVTVNKTSNVTVTATVRDALSNILVGRTCTIASTSTTIATVSPSSRVTNSNGQFSFTVTGQNTGQTSVSVTCESVTQAMTVTVN